MTTITLTIDVEDSWEELPSLNEVAAAYFDYVVANHKGNLTKVCSVLGISRTSYYRWINVDQGHRVRSVSISSPVSSGKT